jgi:hypothetical protein
MRKMNRGGGKYLSRRMSYYEKSHYNYYQVFYTDEINNVAPRVIAASTDRERARARLIRDAADRLGVLQTNCAEALYYIKQMPGVEVVDDGKDLQIYTRKFTYVLTRTRMKLRAGPCAKL